jgi:hypothetical protein
MEKAIFLQALALGACLLVACAWAAGRDGQRSVLETLEKSHPRLILKDKDLDRLKKAVRDGDDILVKCRRDVINQADRYLEKAPPVYRKIGPRLLQVSRDCLNRTYALGLAYRLTGETKYAKTAIENLLAVCAFDDWNPSHFLDTAEMSHAVGIGYDWLYDYLDEPTRKKIRAGLIRNGLEPGLAAYAGKQKTWWAGSNFNWNQVCNGGLIIGALAIAETDPRYAELIVPQAVKSLPKALASYAPDGAWGEGPGYWHYATRYTVYALAALNSALGTDFGLSEAKGLSAAGLFPLHTTGPTGLYVNFADCGENSRRGNMPCLLWLAGRYGQAHMAYAEYDTIRKRRAEPEDFIWYGRPPAGDTSGLPLDKLFGGPVELAVMRSAWDDPGATFVSLKAGYNRVNHGHLDLGQFEIDALGVRWARDLGSDDYNLPGYWDRGSQDGKRWTYYRLNSQSHNVPLLDGRNQNVNAKAKFVKFGSNKQQEAFGIVDLTEAYAPKARRVLRGVALGSLRTRVLVQDELEPAQKCDITWGMTTDAEIRLEGARAVLEQSGQRMTAEILSPAGAKFAVASGEQKPPQKTNKGVRRLLVRLPASQGAVRIAVLFTPQRQAGKAAAPPKLEPLAKW